jgi:hypothetical protein
MQVIEEFTAAGFERQRRGTCQPRATPWDCVIVSSSAERAEQPLSRPFRAWVASLHCSWGVAPGWNDDVPLALKRALEAPTRQIAINSAADDGVVLNIMREGKGNFGFDAAEGVYVDLVDAGMIDPTKVVRVGLENAVLRRQRLIADRGHPDRSPGAEGTSRHPG